MSREKKKREYNEQIEKMLKPNLADIIMCVILWCLAIALVVLHFRPSHELEIRKTYYALTLSLPVIDLIVTASVVFKSAFFRTFSLSAIMARRKGIEKNRVYPSDMYVTALRVFTLIMCLVNVIFLIIVLRVTI